MIMPANTVLSMPLCAARRVDAAVPAMLPITPPLMKLAATGQSTSPDAA